VAAVLRWAERGACHIVVICARKGAERDRYIDMLACAYAQKGLRPFDVDSNGVVVESELAKVFHRVLAHTVLHCLSLSVPCLRCLCIALLCMLTRRIPAVWQRSA